MILNVPTDLSPYRLFLLALLGLEPTYNICSASLKAYNSVFLFLLGLDK